MIKAYTIILSYENGYMAVDYSRYEFCFSKTGSIKFTGKYKPLYWKKELLNSYEFIWVGQIALVVFSSDFIVDESLIEKKYLQMTIDHNIESIDGLKSTNLILSKQLSNYNK